MPALSAACVTATHWSQPTSSCPSIIRHTRMAWQDASPAVRPSRLDDADLLAGAVPGDVIAVGGGHAYAVGAGVEDPHSLRVLGLGRARSNGEGLRDGAPFACGGAPLDANCLAVVGGSD